MATKTPTFGRRIRAAREAAGLSQRRLALSVGVSYQAIQQYEGDASLIASDRMPLMEDALVLPEGTLGAWVRYSPLRRIIDPDDGGGTTGRGSARYQATSRTPHRPATVHHLPIGQAA